MHPVLFEVPFLEGFRVHTYGLMVAFGFLAGMWWVRRAARSAAQDPACAMDLVFYIIIAAIVGSRVLHVLIVQREQVLSDPLVLIRIWEGGLVFYGGLIAAVLVSFWYLRKHHLPALLYADMFSPGIALGHAVGRLGCLAAGCCHGRPAGAPHWWTLTFPANPDSFAPAGVPLYPTQLMESAGELCIFLFLAWLFQRRRFSGQVFALYLMLYAVLRIVLEMYRGDAERGFLIEPWFSTSQLVSVVGFVAGALVYFFGARRLRHSEAA